MRAHKILLKIIFGVFSALSLFVGCDGELINNSDFETSPSPSEGVLYLSPEVHLIGLEDIFEGFVVQKLSFEAEIYLLPLRGGQPADSAIVRYTLNAGQARTEQITGDLAAFGPGQYQVLVRISSSDEQSPSVSLQVGFSCEPAPIPAYCEEGLCSEVSIFSMGTYEFFAGNVEIFFEAQTLEVTWDVRHWLRGLIISPPDLDPPQSSRPDLGVPQPEGFQKR